MSSCRKALSQGASFGRSTVPSATRAQAARKRVSLSWSGRTSLKRVRPDPASRQDLARNPSRGHRRRSLGAGPGKAAVGQRPPSRIEEWNGRAREPVCATGRQVPRRDRRSPDTDPHATARATAQVLRLEPAHYREAECRGMALAGAGLRGCCGHGDCRPSGDVCNRTPHSPTRRGQQRL